MFGAVGDGVADDTKAIQDAIDYAFEQGGGVVAIPYSEHPFIFTHIEVKDNVALIGKGGTLKLKDNVCVDASAKYYPIMNTFSGQNASFIDLIIDGNQENNTSFLVADAITASGKNIVIRGCKIINPPDSGIMFSVVENSVCNDNYISGARDCGIYVNNNGNTELKMGSCCDGNIIVDCYTGIAMKRITQQMSVRGNTIRNCGYGITHENASTDTDFGTDTIVSDNMIVGTENNAIVLRGSAHCVVTGNYIDGFWHYGILAESAVCCTIVGNALRNTFKPVSTHAAGIYFGIREGYPCKNNTVTGNTMDFVNESTSAYSVAFVAIVGNDDVKPCLIDISGNALQGKGMKAGFYVKLIENTHIHDNFVHGVTNFVVATVTDAVNVLMVNNVTDGSMNYMFARPVVARLPMGNIVYQNIQNETPTFAANDGDICLAQNVNASGCLCWVYNSGVWTPVASI